ncbi:MAG: STAS domain-containing protein [Chitinivibrionales bacterium]|nr:STAS domain-containing protein [Chitinivibrionales bacterium]MBD3357815.1 STAS domain-containing protein [Chitinivibrionales bacterium]
MRNGNASVTLTVDENGVALVRISAQVIVNILDTIIMRKVRDYINTHDKPLVVLDLSGVRYLDSFSFTSIIKVRNQVRDKEGELALSGPNDDVLYLFELTDFLKAVPIYMTPEQAIKALAAGNQAGRIMNY